MEFTNNDLKALAYGLGILRRVTPSPDDSVSKKAACAVLGFRVGHTIRLLDTAISAYEEQERAIAVRHARKNAEGAPIFALDDEGKPAGLEIVNAFLMQEELAPILRLKVDIPELKTVDYTLLAAAGVYPSGDLVAALGAFLQGEPTWSPEPPSAPAAAVAPGGKQPITLTED